MDTITSEFLDFNPAPPTVLHVDLNSCFATIEQQANPLYRGKPLAVAAYTTDRGCILAASCEAKKLGIKTGMRVFEGKALCRTLIVLPPDPPKYRFINRKLLALLQRYSADIEVKSIDEMVINFRNSPNIHVSNIRHQASKEDGKEYLIEIAKEIKQKIKDEIGEWLTVSIGIAPNRYLAKIASNLHKPDGLDVIAKDTIEAVLGSLELEQLTGIKEGYGGRLRRHGITTPLALYRASVGDLKTAFASVIGYDWWLWIHGWESALFGAHAVKTIGHSYALPVAYMPGDTRLHQILCQLVEKMGRRVRDNHFVVGGIHVSCTFADHTYWQKGQKLQGMLFASRDIYAAALRILAAAPDKPVRILAVTSFALGNEGTQQLSLLESTERKRSLTRARDALDERWGDFTVFPARMLSMEQKVLDRIAFGGVMGLADVVFHEPVNHEKLYS